MSSLSDLPPHAGRPKESLRFALLLPSTPSVTPSLLEECRASGFGSLYLPWNRSTPEEEQNREALRQSAADRGLKLKTALNPVWNGVPSSTGSGWTCYSHPQTKRELSERVSLAAGFSDEVLFTSPLCTDCACDLCREAKGKRSWPEFRSSLLRNLYREAILEPARSANPDVNVSLVIPALDEETAVPGFDPVTVSQSFHRLFMALSLPTTPSAYVSFRWLGELAGRKAAGAVISHERETDPVRMESSVAEMILAGAKELLFEWGDSLRDETRLTFLRERRALWLHLGRVASQTPYRGVAVYLPSRSSLSEGIVASGVLRLRGIPIRPTPRFPSSSRTAYFPAACASDSRLPEQLGEFLNRGGIAGADPALRATLESSNHEFEALRFTDFTMAAPPSPAEMDAEGSALRNAWLNEFGAEMESEPGIVLHLYGFRDAVLQNLTGESRSARLKMTGRSLRIGAASWADADYSPETGRILMPPFSWVHLRNT